MKKVDFSNTIATGGMKLIWLMKVCEFCRSGSFFTLAQGHLHMKIKVAFLSNHWAIFSQILNVSL